MMSPKINDFLTPPPLVRKFTRPPLLIFITLSAFEGTPLPPSVRTSYMYRPLEAGDLTLQDGDDVIKVGGARLLADGIDAAQEVVEEVCNQIQRYWGNIL